jgi:putative heme-binding domain-containing protein
VEPLQGRVVMSDVRREGTTFRTEDVGFAVTSADPWFKPVDIKHGPDGALYVVDWYDFQVNHWRNYQGNMDAGNGRVYRLKARGGKPVRAEDLRRVPSTRLVELLASPNRWVRETAVRLLGDRRDAAVVPLLQARLKESTGQGALEALWGLNASGGFGGGVVLEALSHPEAAVREWAVRLVGDPGVGVSDGIELRLQDLAARDPDREVRLQLAATARLLPADQALPVLFHLAQRDEDASDPRQPLMIWWALEAKAATHRAAVVDWFRNGPLWYRPLVRDHLLERIMRRYAQSAGPGDLEACAELLSAAQNLEGVARMLAGFEKAFEGRSMAGLPPSLVTLLGKAGGGSLALRLRTGRPGAVEEALGKVSDEAVDANQRMQVIQLLGELKEPRAVPVLLRAAESVREPVRVAALGALGAFEAPDIARRAVALLPGATPPTRTAALSLLTSRAGWSMELARAVDAGRVPADRVTLDAARQMKRFKQAELADLVAKHWPQTGRPTTGEMETRIRALSGIVRGGPGDPYNGKKLYTAQCAGCHKLFAVGGSIGPDLTPYRRDDLETLLLNLVNPSAEIREGYENHLVETRDERSLSGFIVRQDGAVVVLRGLDGQDVVLSRGEITELRPAGMSLMPEGLLDGLSEAEIRDFFAYLRSSQPLPN